MQGFKMQVLRSVRPRFGITAFAFGLALLAHFTTAAQTPDTNVALVAPFSGTTFNGPSSIVLDATIASNVPIMSVSFYAGATLLGSTSTTPYETTWPTPPTGSYSLTAVATDTTGHTTASSPVNIVVNDAGSDFGMLGSPIATPPSGTYQTSQSVILTAAPGATIRYTTDFSTPTGSSAVYTGPLTIDRDTIVKAKAFSDGWTSSNTVTATYQIDSTPPTITAVLSPAPNNQGWNNTPVTVTFECTDDRSAVTMCPDPVEFNQEGANQAITVTARDAVGNQRSTNVAVNIDTTPSTVTMTTPMAETETANATITVAGQVSDGLSGVRWATCTGTPATIDNGSVTCVVPLSPGVNAVTLNAMDTAGNSTSTGVAVTRSGSPTTIMIAPHAQTIVVGETRAITVVSEFGTVHAGFTLTSSDPTIASISSDGSPLIKGEAPGEVTLTATVGERSAEATVTVLGTTLAPGTTRWTLPSATGLFTARAPIAAHRIADNGADLFSVETDGSGALAVVNAWRADGTHLWTQTTSDTPLFGDTVGSLITITSPLGWGTTGGVSLKRIGGPIGGRPWRYDADTGGLEWNLPIQPGAAQGDDGTIYFVETQTWVAGRDQYDNDLYHDQASLLGLDGQTGRVKFRARLPGSNDDRNPGSCVRGGVPPAIVDGFRYAPTKRQFFAGASNITIGPDGAAYLEVLESHDSWDPACHLAIWAPGYGEGGYSPGGQALIWDRNAGVVNRTRELKLIRVDATGTISSKSLWHTVFTGADTEANLGPSEGAVTGPVTPDGAGGLLATWSHYSDQYEYESWISRVVNDTVTNHTVPAFPDGYQAPQVPVLFVDSNRTGYLQYYNTDWSQRLEAIDVDTWSTKWVRQTTARPVLSLDNGNVVLNDSDQASLIEVTPSGSEVATVALVSPLTAPVVISRGQGTLHGIDAGGSLVQVATPEYVESSWFTNTERQSKCVDAPPNPFHRSLLPRGAPYTYRFTTGWEGFETVKASVEEAFDKWSRATLLTKTLNADELPRVYFAQAPSGSTTQDIELIRGYPGAADAAGRFDPVDSIMPDGHITAGLIIFATNTELLSNKGGYLKVALHEIGHSLGLWHTNETQGMSVMNRLGDKNDSANNMPKDVTSCDRKAAQKYR